MRNDGRWISVAHQQDNATRIGAQKDGVVVAGANRPLKESCAAASQEAALPKPGDKALLVPSSGIHRSVDAAFDEQVAAPGALRNGVPGPSAPASRMTVLF